MGEVVSVNVAARAGTGPWAASKGGRSGIDKRPVARPVLLTTAGVEGETVCDTRHHGGPEQAVHACAAEDLTVWAAEFGRSGPAMR
jgi:MOSC domain-containing protein YiiM